MSNEIMQENTPFVECKLFQVQFSPITPGYGLFELLPCNIFAKTAIRYIQGLPEARMLKSVIVPFWKGRA